MGIPTTAVLGAGTMGTALAHVVAAEGRPCRLWCRDEATATTIADEHRHPRFFPGTALASGLTATTDLAAAVTGADVVIVSTPSAAFAETVRAFARVGTREQVVLSSTKGFEPETHERFTELMRTTTPARAVGMIGGPNITPDIMARKLTALQVAVSTPDGIELARRVLSAPYLRVFGTDDVVSVEVVSVLKNVAAIATDIAIGLGLSINTVSYVVTRAFAETRRLSVALGARSDAVLELFGIGDLFLTTMHEASLNRRLGIELGRGKPLAAILDAMGEVPEGVNSVRAHVELAARHHVDSPIAAGVQRILRGELAPSALEELL